MTEKEWRMFNDILLEIYYAGSLETFGERCLKLIRLTKLLIFPSSCALLKRRKKMTGTIVSETISETKSPTPTATAWS